MAAWNESEYFKSNNKCEDIIKRKTCEYKADIRKFTKPLYGLEILMDRELKVVSMSNICSHEITTKQLLKWNL